MTPTHVVTTPVRMSVLTRNGVRPIFIGLDTQVEVRISKKGGHLRDWTWRSDGRLTTQSVSIDKAAMHLREIDRAHL